MIRRSIIAVAAVITFSAAAASTQAFADVSTPECALLIGTAATPTASALPTAAPHD